MKGFVHSWRSGLPVGDELFCVLFVKSEWTTMALFPCVSQSLAWIVQEVFI